VLPLLLAVLADVSAPGSADARPARLERAQAEAARQDPLFARGKPVPARSGVLIDGLVKGHGYEVSVFAEDGPDDGWHVPQVTCMVDIAFLRAMHRNGLTAWMELSGEQPRWRVRLFRRIFRPALEDCLRRRPPPPPR
jgi:hypothetical protein